MPPSPSDLTLVFHSGPERAEPFLTVVVAAYRHEQFIDELLASVNAAASLDLELVIIDDGSPDGTLAHCQAFPYDERLPVRLYTKKNAGVIDSLRRGLELARGRHVTFIGSDDLYCDGALARACELLNRDERALDALLCQAVMIGLNDGAPVYGDEFRRLFGLEAAARHEAVCSEFPKPMLLQATVFRTAFLRGLNIWDGKYELDDWPVFIRVFEAEAQGRATVRYDDSLRLSYMRVHAGGIHNRLDRQLRVCEQVARSLVPSHLRRRCLANVRIDIGLMHLYQRQLPVGALLVLRGLVHCPTPAVIGRVLRRFGRFARKTLAPAAS
jgi:glycosyltransferase involved in cell wall biosynthesis